MSLSLTINTCTNLFKKYHINSFDFNSFQRLILYFIVYLSKYIKKYIIAYFATIILITSVNNNSK